MECFKRNSTQSIRAKSLDVGLMLIADPEEEVGQMMNGTILEGEVLLRHAAVWTRDSCQLA